MSTGISERIKILTELGLSFDGEQYISKEKPELGINVHMIDIKCLSDEIFSDLMSKIKNILED